MKIRCFNFALSILINAILLACLISSEGSVYSFQESPPIILRLVRNENLKLPHANENLQNSEKPSIAPRISRKKRLIKGDSSSIRPLVDYDQVETGAGKSVPAPRLSLGCSLLTNNSLSREERQLCSERLGRSLRDPSTPTYSIAIPPDKMKAYNEAYERQQELVGRTMPKVFASGSGPGSNFGLGSIARER